MLYDSGDSRTTGPAQWFQLELFSPEGRTRFTYIASTVLESASSIPCFWCNLQMVSWPRPLIVSTKYHKRVNLARNGPGTTRNGSNRWKIILLKQDAATSAPNSWIKGIILRVLWLGGCTIVQSTRYYQWGTLYCASRISSQCYRQWETCLSLCYFPQRT